MVSLWLLYRVRVAEIKNTSRTVDYWGAVLCSLGLAGVVFSLIEEPSFGWVHPFIYLPLMVGIASLIIFFILERKNQDPMLPLFLFRANGHARSQAARASLLSNK